MNIRDESQLCELLNTPFSAEQLEAICAPLSPGVIIAGAGTGKTTVMAARVVWLVGTGQVQPDQVLGLTFTRKAAAELGARVAAALARAGLLNDSDEQGSEVVLTYDAFAGRLVRDFGLRLGLEATAELLSGASRHRLATWAVANHETPLASLARLAHRSLPERVLALDSALAANLVSPGHLRSFTERTDREFAAAPRYRGKVLKIIEEARRALAERLELLGIVEDYQARKAELGLVEFADQQGQAVRLARDVPQVGHALRERFKVVLLDEYQDTSTAQALLLRSLFSGPSPETGRGFPVTAVGDPNQAIYAWRGAAASNITGFARHFPQSDGTSALRFDLAINRRSGHRILALGNQLAAPLSATESGGVQLAAPQDAPAGQVIAASYDTLDDELAALAADIAARHAAGTEWGDVAVLTRRNNILAATYEALRARDIPVEIVGLGGLLHLPEIAPVVDTLRVLADPLANPACANLLTGTRWRIGLEDMAVFARRAKEIDPDEPCLVDAISDPGQARLSDVGRARARQFAAELAELRTHLDEPVGELVRRVIARLGLESECALWGDQSQLSRFAELAAEFPSLGQPHDLTGLLAWLDAEDEHGEGLDQATPSHSDSVKLLTAHRAKGLEWHTVYLPALTDGVFPGKDRDGTWVTNASLLPASLRGDAENVPQLREYSKKGIEDYRAEVMAEHRLSEDRLAYVAATRAKRVLVLSTHTWAPGLKTEHVPSPYFEAAVSVADRVSQATSSPENPRGDMTRKAEWPTPLTDRERSHMAAARLVTQAREVLAAGEDSEQWVWRSGVASARDRERIAAWDNDAEFLTEQVTRRMSRELVLPSGLSASALMEMNSDRNAFAERLLRRMPKQPRRSARLGEQFHEWVMGRFGSSPGFDELDYRPQSQDPALVRLQEAFEASQFATLVPLGVEVPFLLRWRDLVLRGRIDAVFPSTDPAFDAVIVDWKIGNQATDPLQLAIYRQAWAEAQGLDLVRVATGFHHVLANRFEPVVAGPELIEAATCGISSNS